MAETRTTRVALPSYSAGTDSFSRGDWNEATASIEALMAIDAFGTRALRPAPAVRGRYYAATDTKVIFRDSGTAWDVVGAFIEGPQINTAAVAADVIQTFKGVAAQSGNIIEYRSSTNALLYNLAADGSVVSVATISARLLRALGTAIADVPLRAGGIVGQTGNLFELQVDGSNVYSVNASGDSIPRNVAPSGLPGATQSARFVGATTTGPPVTGTFGIGDFVVSRSTGSFWVCTVAGSPGTWVEHAQSTSVAPPGQITMFAGAAAPGGYLLCDGAAVSRTTYSALYAALGSAASPYGQGNGTTTFNTPNIKGKTVIGVDAAQVAFDALGELGGANTVTLAIANLPSHAHAVDHDHAAFASAAGSSHNHVVAVTVNGTGAINTGGVSANHTHDVSHGHTASAGGVGDHSHLTQTSDVYKGAAVTAPPVKYNAGVPGDGTYGGGAHNHGVTVDINYFSSGTISVDHSHNYNHGHSASGVNTAEAAHTHSVDVPAFVGSSGTIGSGTPVSLLTPFIALNYIVKT